MSRNSSIEWCDDTWNPVSGCTKVSAGCDNCYAETFAERWRGTSGHYFEHGFDVQLRPDKLTLPLRWRKPRRIFVNSMSDLFHDSVPDEYIAKVFAVMAAAPQHTFQVLTKRHARMRSLLSSKEFEAAVFLAHDEGCFDGYFGYSKLPLPNVWLGISAENQQWADIRIPELLDTPAAVRWVSAEPLLGPIDLDNCGGYQAVTPKPFPGLTYLKWVVVGGESGPKARPMHPDWARSLRDQCQEAGVPFLFKQWGEYAPGRIIESPQFRGGAYFDDGGHVVGGNPAVSLPSVHNFGDGTGAYRAGKGRAGRLLDGREWNEYPQEVRK